MKKLLILIFTFLSLILATVSFSSPLPSFAQKVNRKYEVVLKDKEGNTKTYLVCAENEEQAKYGAMRAWSHPGQYVLSINFIGPCSD